MWSLDHGFEFIDMDVSEITPPPTWNEREKDGLPRLLESLNSHTWSTMVKKGDEKKGKDKDKNKDKEKEKEKEKKKEEKEEKEEKGQTLADAEGSFSSSSALSSTEEEKAISGVFQLSSASTSASTSAFVDAVNDSDIGDIEDITTSSLPSNPFIPIPTSTGNGNGIGNGIGANYGYNTGADNEEKQDAAFGDLLDQARCVCV